jgi:hypothetical protein
MCEFFQQMPLLYKLYIRGIPTIQVDQKVNWLINVH